MYLRCIDHHRDRNAKKNLSTIYGFHKSRTRTVYFRHTEKNLAKAVVISGVLNDKSIRKVKLVPTGTVIGQLITEAGIPLSDVYFQLRREIIHDKKSLPNLEPVSVTAFIPSDQEGKFVIQNLIVGADYKLVITKLGG